MSILRILLLTVAVGAFVLGNTAPEVVHAQPDSVRAKILKERGFPPNHSPRGALWRTAAVPGWGQYYNRQYYKIPVVYAGLAALGFRIYRANDRYLLFDRAHLFGLGRQEEGENPHSQYESQYEKVKEQIFLGQSVRLGEVRKQRDKFRRQRDLAILGTAVFYALTLLDAYVSAHLLTFDVDDDLAVRVRPTGTPGSRLGSRMASGESAQQGGPHDASALTEGMGMRVEVRF